MQNTTVLPENYVEILEIDLQKNKKLAIFVNVFALVITAIMIVVAAFFVPMKSLFDFSEGFGVYFLRFGVLIVALVVYVLIHELIHGFFMKKFSGVKPSYGFTLMYAYAGSTAYFNKKSYLIIGLAPLVILGIVLLIINLLVPIQWWWVVYFIQVINCGGAAGDMYVTSKFKKLPKDILVLDRGIGMKVFSANT